MPNFELLWLMSFWLASISEGFQVGGAKFKSFKCSGAERISEFNLARWGYHVPKCTYQAQEQHLNVKKKKSDQKPHPHRLCNWAFPHIKYIRTEELFKGIYFRLHYKGISIKSFLCIIFIQNIFFFSKNLAI